MLIYIQVYNIMNKMYFRNNADSKFDLPYLAPVSTGARNTGTQTKIIDP